MSLGAGPGLLHHLQEDTVDLADVGRLNIEADGQLITVDRAVLVRQCRCRQCQRQQHGTETEPAARAPAHATDALV